MLKQNLRVWMDKIECAQLMAAIAAVRPARFLEWGSGGSTKAILEHCPFIEEYIAIEHDGAWYQKVKQQIDDLRLGLFHVAADKPLPPGKHSGNRQKEWHLAAELNREIMARYIAFPRRLNRRFQFVLVDGRARRFCLEESYALLDEGGVLVIHDAQRPEYGDAIGRWGHPLFLTPWKQGQLCLIKKAAGQSRLWESGYNEVAEKGAVCGHYLAGTGQGTTEGSDGYVYQS